MAQKSIVKVTARKIVNPANNVIFDGGSTSSGTTKDVTIVMWGCSAVIMSVPARTGSTSTDDSLIWTSDGWQITCVQESSDLATALSATDSTGS